MDIVDQKQPDINTTFSGNVYLLRAVDIGDDISLNILRSSTPYSLKIIARTWPKFFKNYHTPLTVQLADENHTHGSNYANIHHFGVLSFVYKVPFTGTLTDLRAKLNTIDEQYDQQSLEDAHTLYRKTKSATKQPYFFHHHGSYLVIHIDPQSTSMNSAQLRQQCGSLIASMLRFETKHISEFQVNEILESTTGYYREDLVFIDTESALVFDSEPEELLDFFELALIQKLELTYFDRVLDQKLDQVYNQGNQKVTIGSYLPFIGMLYNPIEEFSKLRVDISVIIERLGNTIRLAGEPFYSEVYNLLVHRLDLDAARLSVEKKLEIVKDIRTIYQSKIDSVREDLLSVLVIVLITIEVCVAILK